MGFSYVELNASDTRSKRSLKEVVAESLDNNTLVDYTDSASKQHQGTGPSGQSHCLIMDEVDGMAGNEDRGGLQVGGVWCYQPYPGGCFPGNWTLCRIYLSLYGRHG